MYLIVRECLRMVTYTEGIRDKIRKRLNSYYSVQELLSSHPLSKTLKVKIYKRVALPVLYVCKAWLLTSAKIVREKYLTTKCHKHLDRRRK
jgi:hypothetical protein